MDPEFSSSSFHFSVACRSKFFKMEEDSWSEPPWSKITPSLQEAKALVLYLSYQPIELGTIGPRLAWRHISSFSVIVFELTLHERTQRMLSSGTFSESKESRLKQGLFQLKVEGGEGRLEEQRRRELFLEARTKITEIIIRRCLLRNPLVLY